MITRTIANIFRGIAKILAIKGANVFPIRAYERAAMSIESLSEDIQDIINEDRLRDIPGIGKDLSQKILEIVASGKLKFYESLKKTIPEGLLELLDVPSIGPKHAKLFYEKLDIKNIAELEKAAKEGKLFSLEGVKGKRVENILKGIELVKKGKERIDLGTAISIADDFINRLKEIASPKRLSPAGSLRRMKETARDIDILAVSNNPGKTMDAFVGLQPVRDIIAKGQTKSSILTKDGVQIDLRVVEEKSYGAALVYFTGSKNFNIKLRQLAIKKDLKVNEYGVFVNKETYIAGKSEEEVFRSLGLSFIEPELREDTGEIELAAKNKLPELVSVKDIKGDFHAHSKYSDGNNTIEEMSNFAKNLGYEYICITDHSQSLKVAGGLSLSELKKKKDEIDRLNSKLSGFRILFGTETEIDSKGDLDYPDKVLAGFDIVVAAIHSGFKQSRQQITKRIVKACKNKHVDIIAHPTGRLWGTRESYELDFQEIFKAASDYGTTLEVNAYPLRLDLSDVNCRKAKEKGIRLAIGTDSHLAEQLRNIRLGVAVCRRGWLSKKDVLNTLTLNELLGLLKR